MIQVKPFVVNMLQENCYVVSDETNECVIIDCGAFYEEEQKAIDDYIKNKHLHPIHLIATHGHLDHHFGDAFVFEKYGLQPEVAEEDLLLMQHLGRQAETFYGFTLEGDYPEALQLKQEITFGNHVLSVIKTPGHSQGSVCFYCKEENLLFTGDTLFRRSVGRTDFKGGSMMQIIQSLRRIAQLNDETDVLPGHGPATTIGDELANNPFMER